METLYCSSRMRTNVLIPPLKRPGVPRDFLYADTNKDRAVHDAFETLLRMNYQVKDYRVEGDLIYVSIADGTHPTKAVMDTWSVFLYTIQPNRKQWQKLHGHAHCTRWVTTDMVFSRSFKVQSLSISKWLQGKTVKVCNAAFIPWA